MTSNRLDSAVIYGGSEMSDPITNPEVRAIFDAIPEGLVVRESAAYGSWPRAFRVVGERPRGLLYDWEELDRRGRHQLEEGASGRKCSEINISRNPMSFLFGRNGAGKTRLLDAISEFTTGHRSLLGVAVKLRLPTDDLIEGWRTSARSALNEEWFSELADKDWNSEDERPDDVDSDVLQRLYRLPIVEDIRQSLLRDPGIASPDSLGFSQKDHLEMAGFSQSAVQGWIDRDVHRWGPRRKPTDSQVTAPYAFLFAPSVRTLAAEYYFHYLSRVPVIDEKEPYSADGDVWSSTSAWFDSPGLAELIGPAVEEFMTRCTHVEYVHSGHFRLLASPEDVPAVMAYLAAARDFMEDQFKKFFPKGTGIRSSALSPSLPLDMFRLQDGGQMVESVLLKSVPWGRSTKHFDVVNLTPDHVSSEQMEPLIRRLAGRHMEMRLHILEKDPNTLLVQLEGYETLRRVAEKVSLVAARCECGIEEVRIRGIDPNHLEAGFIRSMESSVVQYGYYGDDVFGAIPSPTVQWKDKNSGEWLDFDDASLGQRQVMMILLSIELIAESDSRSAVTFVVGDEIDKNLHWRASSRLMEEISEWLSKENGIYVIFSTHTVPGLGSTKMAGINRVFARREGSAFNFVSSREADDLLTAEVLGVNPHDVLRFADLLLVVEGDHEELIFGSKFLNSHPHKDRISVVNGGGLYSWSGILNNSLQHLDAPILFVYDKRNERLETEWTRIHEIIANGRALPNWHQTDFAKLHAEIKSRRVSRRIEPGDDEAGKILWLLENNVFEPRAPLHRLQPNATLAKRIHLHGLEADDVVDLLPISFFPKANKKFTNWVEAHETYPRGQVFKEKLDINHRSLISALDKDESPRMNPEIQRLVNRINSFLDC